MPNVSKRPADAEKLDPQEQLKKLRDSLLRDAEVRPGGAGDEGQKEALSKKEAAARRFAGAGGGAAARSAVGTASPAGAKTRAAGPVSSPRGPQVSAASAQQGKPGARVEDPARTRNRRSGERQSNSDIPRRAPSRPEANRRELMSYDIGTFGGAALRKTRANPRAGRFEPARGERQNPPAMDRPQKGSSDVDGRSVTVGEHGTPCEQRASHPARDVPQLGQHSENRQP